MFSLLHFSDPHFGADTDLEKVEATISTVADLEPDLVVVSGDLTQRARHGEFQAAKVWLNELARTSATMVVPGNHDVEWWRRPLLPFGRQRQYRKFSSYFGPVLSPTIRFPEVVVTGALTAHGVTWRSLTPSLRDLSVIGHVAQKEIAHAKQIFAEAGPAQARVLVMHHNVLRGEHSDRMGVTRWKKAHAMLRDSGADVILCGHDHQAKADVMGGMVISCAGSFAESTRTIQPSFHRLLFDGGVQVEVYVWEPDLRLFRRTDVHAFAIGRTVMETHVPAGVV